tara:strand:+ start:306 stop:806 length:501 start_codon:yes stop_codon:yes gene_type:complete
MQDFYASHSFDEVFDGVVEVVNDPEYTHRDSDKRWLISSNHVSIDEENSRVEVLRRLERVLRRKGAKDLYELREYHFIVEVIEGNPVSVVYKELGPSIPVKVQREADRFFRQLRKYLGLPFGDDWVLDSETLPEDLFYPKVLENKTDSDQVLTPEPVGGGQIIPPS